MDEEAGPVPASPDYAGRIRILHPSAKDPSPEDAAFLQGAPTKEEKEIFYKKDYLPYERHSPLKDAKLLKQTLQFCCRATVRFREKTYLRALVGIFPHFIIVLYQEEGKHDKPYQQLCQLHVLDIKKLYFGINYQNVKFLMVRLISQYQNKQKIKPKVTIASNEYAYQCARHVFRNVNLAFSTAIAATERDQIDYYEIPAIPIMNTHDSNLFPKFNGFLSPAQEFQFTYYALCTLENYAYDHDIVKYFHYQIVNYNGIFNVGRLPQFYLDKSRQSKELMPVFRALIYSPYIFGIVADHISRPDIFEASSLQLMLSRSVRFLHFSYCEATKGLKSLAEVLGDNPQCPIEYLDISGNELTDFKGFFKKAFCARTTPIYYLNLNHCNVSSEILIQLFNCMFEDQTLESLKYLHIAGSEYNEEARLSFETYLTNKQSLVCLKSIDLGDINLKENDLTPTFEMLTTAAPLQCLYLYNTQLSQDEYDALQTLLKKRPTITTLDISGTGLDSSKVSAIVNTLGLREGHDLITLKINNLNLHGGALLAIMKGFLNSDLTRWKEIYLDSNKMIVSDLQLIVSVFHHMPNLVELSLNDNFDFALPNIDEQLPELLKISTLERLHISGTENNCLRTKVRPLLLAIGISYVARNYIGGLSIQKTLKELLQYEKDVFSRMIPLLKQFEAQGTISYLKQLQKRSSEVLHPILINEKTRKSGFQLKDDKATALSLAESLVPLIKAVAHSYKVPEKRNSKSFGANIIGIIAEYERTVKDHPNADISSFVDSLSQKLLSYLAALGKFAHLKYLDISHNKIEMSGVECVAELLKVDKELSGVEIDGSNMSTVSSVVEFVKIISSPKQDHITELHFPINDMHRMVSRAKDHAKDIVERDLVLQQEKLIRVIDYNRCHHGLLFGLPFKPVKELQDTIDELTLKLRSYLRLHSLRSHSGVCEQFHLNLPYLDEDEEWIGLPDDYVEIELTETQMYEAPGMVKRFDEFDDFTLPLNLLALKIAGKWKEEEEEDIPEPIDVNLIRQVVALPDLPDFETEIESSSETESESVMHNIPKPEDEEEIEKEKPPRFDFDDHVFDSPEFYAGKVEQYVLDAGDDDNGPTLAFNTQFRKLISYRNIDVSDADVDIKFTPTKKRKPPPKF